MIKSYNDKLLDIEVYKEQLEYAIESRDITQHQIDKQCPKDIKAMAYNSIGKSCRNDTTLDILEGRKIIYNDRIDYYSSRLNNLKKELDSIAINLAKCEGLHYKVYKLNRIDGKTLAEVADILGKSDDYILHVSSEINQIIKNDKGVSNNEL